MIIDFNKNNGGGSADLTNYWNSAQTQDAINEATEDLVTSGEVQTQIDDSLSGISVDLSDYYTSAQTEDAITSKGYVNSGDVETQITNKNYVTSAETKTQIEGYNYITSSYTGYASAEDFNTLSGIVQTNEQVTSEAINNLNTAISGIVIPDVSEFITSADVQTQVESYNYVNSGQVQTQIENSLSGIDLSNYVTSAETAEINNHIDDFERVTSLALNDLNDRVNTISGSSSSVDLSAYWTSAQTESAITAAVGNIDLTNYYTSAQTEDAITGKGYVTSGDVQTQIEGYNYVTSGQVETQITSKNYVDSTDIRHIVKISQADYSTLVSGGTVDSYTWYLITGTTA